MSSEVTFGSLSGLEFRVLASELSAALKDSYLSNIYSMGENQLFRMRKPGGEELSMVLSPKFGAWLTEVPARAETTEFTTALRASLLRTKLVSVSQYDLDRVLFVALAGKDGEFKLVLEMMPPGNLVVLGAGEKVLLTLRELRSEKRRLISGIAYTPPPQGKTSPDSITRDTLSEALSREKTLGKALGRGLSLPRKYVDEVLARAGKTQDDPAKLGGLELERVLAAIREIIAGLANPQPCTVRSGDRVEFMSIRPKSGEVLESSPTLSPLLDKAFSGLLIGEEPVGEALVDDRRAKAYQATIEKLESEKADLAARSKRLRELAGEVRRSPDAARAIELLVSSDLARGLSAKLRTDKVASITSAVFDEAKRLEGKSDEAEAALEDLRGKLEKASRKAPRGPRAVSLERKKKEWFEKFRWFYTTQGRLAIGGRDAQSNSTLIKRHMDKEDTVYHADLFGSPFFVLKGGSAQTEGETREVGKATVAFSSAWKTGLGAADAYWVAPDQVAAAGPSGEYLAHGSFAIKGKKNFVTKIAVEVSVGIDDQGRIVSGPEESIMRVAKAHVTMIPHREKSSDTAKKVVHELRSMAGQSVSLGVDDVLRMLPAGGGKIVRRRLDKRA